MKRLGNLSTNDCPLYFAFVPDFAGLAELHLPSAHTVLLIVADSGDVPSSVVGDAAERLFAGGLAYVCVWGPDCGRVHDIFDETHVGDGSIEPQFSFMSTSHDDESLDEALFFFLRCAIPIEADLAAASYVAVTVGRPDWAAAVQHALADADAFVSRMLADESPASGQTP